MPGSSNREEVKDKNVPLEGGSKGRKEGNKDVNVVVKGRVEGTQERTFDEVEGTRIKYNYGPNPSESILSLSVSRSSSTSNDEHKEEIEEERTSNDDAVAFREKSEGSRRGERSSANEGTEQMIVRQNRRFSWIQMKQVQHDVHTGYIKCSGSNDQGNSESEVTRIHVQRKMQF